MASTKQAATRPPCRSYAPCGADAVGGKSVGNADTGTACHEDGWDAEDGHDDDNAGLRIPANIRL